jgi:hypothetical protein
MTIVKHITIDNEVINISEIEARAHQLRAEAMAEYGRNFRDWLKSLDFKFDTVRVPH